MRRSLRFELPCDTSTYPWASEFCMAGDPTQEKQQLHDLVKRHQNRLKWTQARWNGKDLNSYKTEYRGILEGTCNSRKLLILLIS